MKPLCLNPGRARAMTTHVDCGKSWSKDGSLSACGTGPGAV